MRSFAGRDILSLKDFERNEFFRVFEIAEEKRVLSAGQPRADTGGRRTMDYNDEQPESYRRYGKRNGGRFDIPQGTY